MYEFTRLHEDATQAERNQLMRKSFAPNMTKEAALEWSKKVMMKNHAIFGVWSKETLAAMICIKHPIENHIRGANLSFGGIGDVSTLPEHRRERLIRKIFGQVFTYMNENDIVYSALGPFSFPFYEKFGYALAEQILTYEFPGQYLKAMRGDPSIVMRAYQPADAENVLLVQRSMGRFGSRLFLPKEKLTSDHAYVLEQNNAIVGFVRFSFKNENHMQVEPVFFTRDDVFPTVVDLVYRYGSQVKTISWKADPEIYLEAALKQPGMVKRRQDGHMMIRVVKFREFCQQIKVPLVAAESVIVHLEDHDCPWNNGTFKLTPVSGRLEIQETDKDPEINLNALQLSHVVGGLMTANDLRRMGGLECPASAAERLSRIFPLESFLTYTGF